MNLAPFKNPKDLHQTTLDFFVNTLHIKINAFDAKPFTKEDFFKDKEKVKTAAVKNIDYIYVIGLVDDDSLAEKREKFTNKEDIEKITKDYDGLVVCALVMKTAPKRADLASLTRLVNRVFPYLPVTIVFQYDDKITFANAERTQYLQAWREGEKIGKISMLKDIAVENPHGAHLKILRDLKVSDKITDFNALYEHWQSVLNTKELNKEFFKKIANWYFWSVAKSKFPFEYLKLEEKYRDKSNAELQELANQKATIRFITRIIFVWFLKEKKLIPDFLFEQDEIEKILKKDRSNSNYYNAILQNLFFATLNRPKETREFAPDIGFNENKKNRDVNSLYRFEKFFKDEAPKNVMQLFAEIPFLNGGLFDSLDIKATKKDEFPTQIIDGFSRTASLQAKMPDELFFESKNIDFNNELNETYQTKSKNYEVKGLFAIFEEYKFTIEENTPLEVDVALDPYLLGEIFENLLAYYNPETGATARKGSGSFYTPQEIVNYMVDQSLLAYLKTQLPEMEWENFEPLNNLSKPNARKVVEKLCNIKILDPACGSGAFPMGVLYKMVSIFSIIDKDNALLKQVQHDKIIGNKIAELEADKKAIQNLNDQQVKEKATAEADYRLQELETIFDNEYNYDDYARKLFLIQNCIYGVDIQDVAIQISKLRFFLSLIIDQKNENIQPLPNLETKFVIANTLIGIELPKLQFLGEEDHSEDHTKELKEQLKAVRQKHFNATTRTEKNKIKKEDKAIRLQIADSLAESVTARNSVEIELLKTQIEKLNAEILKAEKLPETAEMEAGDLFETKMVKTFPRKEKIAELTKNIKTCERKIERLQTTTQADKIREQALKIAQWDIYNQNAQADWFDMDWMFGVQDGFDVVIGNPPYVVFNGKLKEEGEKLLKFKIFEKCKGGKLNAYELFLAKTDDLLIRNGISCQIFQNSFLGDNSSKGIREFYLNECNILKIDSFPERDNPKKRVFESVKMSVCILLSRKNKINDYLFELVIHKDKTLEDFNNVFYSSKEIFKINPTNGVIPNLLEADKEIFIKYKNSKYKYEDYFECIEGELNMTFHKKYMTKNENFPKIIKGAQVQRYFITDKPSQGEVEFVNKTKYLKDYIRSKKSQHYKIERIVLQGITGANDKIRLVCSFINPDLFCANSANYIIANSKNNLIKTKTLLAILNSKLTNWIFRKSSTNSNVNCYEINDLSLPNNLKILDSILENLVNQILEGKKNAEDTAALEHQIDVMVYHLYGLSFAEAQIIDADLQEEDFLRIVT